MAWISPGHDIVINFAYLWRHQFCILMESSILHTYGVNNFAYLWSHKFCILMASSILHTYGVINFAYLWRHQFCILMESSILHTYGVINFAYLWSHQFCIFMALPCWFVVVGISVIALVLSNCWGPVLNFMRPNTLLF